MAPKKFQKNQAAAAAKAKEHAPADENFDLDSLMMTPAAGADEPVAAESKRVEAAASQAKAIVPYRDKKEKAKRYKVPECARCGCSWEVAMHKVSNICVRVHTRIFDCFLFSLTVKQ